MEETKGKQINQNNPGSKPSLDLELAVVVQAL
jgi:hypothetical protein